MTNLFPMQNFKKIEELLIVRAKLDPNGLYFLGVIGPKGGNSNSNSPYMIEFSMSDFL